MAAKAKSRPAAVPVPSVVVTRDGAQAILEYLSLRPWGEVQGLVPFLVNAAVFVESGS